MENTKYTISRAFKECFYVVPDYQREYIWTEKHINQLLEDIDEQIAASSKEYFIGIVLVSPRQGHEDHFDIIDGQQRLTTIFLILCALRVLFKDMPQSEILKELTKSRYTDFKGGVINNLRLELQYENAKDVIEKIVKVNGDPQAVRANIQNFGISIHGSVKNILNAYDIIYRYLTDNYSDVGKLKKYWGYLANKVVFIQIKTDVSNALKIFETINERGVGLNPMDLLKNLLFTQVSPESFSRLKDEWKKITSPLEKNKKKPLRFFRYFLMANYDANNDAVVREDEIYDWFSKKNNAKQTDYQDNPFEFIRKITRNVERYIDFINVLGNDRKKSDAMYSLKKLTGSGTSMYYVLLLAAANLPKSLFDQFVAQLESFLFYYIFTKTPTKRLEHNFSTWAGEVRKISQIENPEEQREKLNIFIDECFVPNMKVKAHELNDALKRLTFPPTQKYKIRYLLARLTQHVDMAFSGDKLCGSLEPYLKLEIEHILPNNPENDLRSAWEKQHPELLYDDIKIRLGNLTLLEKPLNIVAGNDFYLKKLPKYALSGNYLTRSLAQLADVGQNTSISRINEKLSSFDKWDAESIEKRQLLLIELALEIWKTTEITI